MYMCSTSYMRRLEQSHTHQSHHASFVELPVVGSSCPLVNGLPRNTVGMSGNMLLMLINVTTGMIDMVGIVGGAVVRR